MTSEPQYDQIAEQYHQASHALLKEYVIKPTFIKMVGNLMGKNAVDLACGSGYSTRLLKVACSAGTTVGVDISAKEIEIARREECQQPLGIDYLVGDVANFDFSGFDKFATATALFLLHYSSSKEELSTMCKNIFSAIEADGQFVTVLPNPELPTVDTTKYEISATMDLPVREGAKRRITYHSQGKEQFAFDHYYWSIETYDNALRTAGFRDIQWIPPSVSKEGIDKFGTDFWQEYFEMPHQLGIVCLRP